MSPFRRYKRARTRALLVEIGRATDDLPTALAALAELAVVAPVVCVRVLRRGYAELRRQDEA